MPCVLKQYSNALLRDIEIAPLCDESIQDQLRGRRLIETERAKPYIVVRQITAITLVVLGGVFVFSPAFFAGYVTPLGQLILLVLLALYFGSLVVMRRKAQQRTRPRILTGSA